MSITTTRGESSDAGTRDSAPYSVHGGRGAVHDGVRGLCRQVAEARGRDGEAFTFGRARQLAGLLHRAVDQVDAHLRLAEREHGRPGGAEHQHALASELERLRERVGSAPGVGVAAHQEPVFVDDGVHRANAACDRIQAIEQGDDRLEWHRHPQTADPERTHAGERTRQIGFGDGERHVGEARAESP